MMTLSVLFKAVFDALLSLAISSSQAKVGLFMQKAREFGRTASSNDSTSCKSVGVPRHGSPVTFLSRFCVADCPSHR